MRLPKIIAVPAAALTVIAAGLTVGATLPTYEGVAAPTPTASFTLPPVLADAVQCEEDEPCWDCETMGNKICGVMAEPMRRSAWKAFDAAGGAGELLVNPHAKVTLTGYSIVDPYEEGTPTVHQLALHDSGVWYVFTTEAV